MSLSARKGHVTRAMNRLDVALANSKDVLGGTTVEHDNIADVRETIITYGMASAELKECLQIVEQKKESMYAAIEQLPDGKSQEEALKMMEDMEMTWGKLTLPAENAYRKLVAILDLLNKELECLLRQPAVSAPPEVPQPPVSTADPSVLPSVSLPSTVSTSMPSAVPTSVPSTFVHSTVLPTAGSVRLPVMELQKFNGDIFAWAAFWDYFRDTIDIRRDLSDAQKMYYLYSCLVGDAKRAVANLSPTSANYAKAKEILQERFGGEEIVLSACYKAIQDLPTVPDRNIRKLRVFYDKVEGHFRSLASLGQDTDQMFFKTLLQRKLPYEVQSELYDKEMSSEAKWTVTEWRAALGKYVLKKETLSSFQNLEARQTQRPQPGGKKPLSNWSTPSAQALTTTESQRKLPCLFCKGEHWPDDCTRYASAFERRQQIPGRCFVCFRQDHRKEDCDRKRPCLYCKAVGDHHKSLCSKKFPSNTSQKKAKSAAKPQTEDSCNPAVEFSSETSSTACPDDDTSGEHLQAKDQAMVATGQHVLMQTAVTTASCGKRSCSTRLFFDSGSTRTWCSQELAKTLGLPKERLEKVEISTFGGNKQTINSYSSSLKLSHLHGTITIHLNIVPVLVHSMVRSAVTHEDAALLRNSCSMPLADNLLTHEEKVPIHLLIGADYYAELVTGPRHVIRPGLYVLSSLFGGIVTGRSSALKSDTTSGLLVTGCCLDEPVPCISCTSIQITMPPDSELHKFWDLETLGIRDSPVESDDDHALQTFNETVIYENNRYSVCLPWKDKSLKPPDNYHLAEGRLKSLVKRLRLEPDHLVQYDKVIQEQVQNGIIEAVDNAEHLSDGKHYLPHHAVIRADKETTKVRIVYDGSARTRLDHYSLNDCLHRGQVFAKDLVSLLMRFRMGTIAVVADIEKAFLQVGLQEVDRDMTRFLWLKDLTKVNIDNNLQTFRFCRIPFGLVSSPFLLGATVKFHLQKVGTPCSSLISQNIYVDNVLANFNTLQEAKTFHTEAKEIFQSASMNLREWVSNAPEFMQFVPKKNQGPQVEVSVLGLKWHPENDKLSISTNLSTTFDKIRKRDILSSIASVFDPLGFFGPVLLEAKLLLQSLAKRNAGWDDILTQQELLIWKPILEDLSQICKQQMPRCIGLVTSDEVQYDLLCFSDSSEKAYATVLYLRQSDLFHVKVDLIFSKSRLVPLKSTMTIPRLELMAVLIGIRAIQLVTSSLHINIRSIHLWTDSQCVLYWLTSPRPLTVFVENRVREIRAHCGIIFHHVSTADNPADIPTRGMSVADLMSAKTWWHGPSWVQKSPDQWATWDPREVTEDDEQLPETEFRRLKSTLVSISSCEPSAAAPEAPYSVAGIDINQFSSLTHLLRVTGWVIRFIQKSRKKATLRGELTLPEIQDAEFRWVKEVQSHFFPDLVKGDTKPTPDLQKKLGIKQDSSGILRCHGRLGHADLSQAARTPCLLPTKCHLTTLIVHDVHQRIKHFGVSFTLSELRKRYWVPKGRAEVSRILKECTTCRKLEGGPYRLPEVPALPSCRVRPSEPFEYVGLDYLGPIYAKEHKQASCQKVWICLFTCLSVRAVHLEIVGNLSAEQFLMALRRFMSRRGRPKTITLDNATQFKLGKDTYDLAWAEVMSEPSVERFTLGQSIKWIFIPEHAPWMGGFYERLVGLTKRALKKSVGRSTLTITELQTLLTEVEMVLNSRPLTFISEDINSSQVLTPNHFLGIHSSASLLPLDASDPADPSYIANASQAEQLLETWKVKQTMLNKFWTLWKDDYLLNLRERYVTLQQARSCAPGSPVVGTIVLIKADTPRLFWKLGCIEELVTSADGQVRSALVRMPNGRVFKRSISHLYPVELGVPPDT